VPQARSETYGPHFLHGGRSPTFSLSRACSLVRGRLLKSGSFTILLEVRAALSAWTYRKSGNGKFETEIDGSKISSSHSFIAFFITSECGSLGLNRRRLFLHVKRVNKEPGRAEQQ